ncbi:MAG TPA: HlyD family efflux transporter periplasmic adaptor subunit [Vicinamibacterales bacterium]|nr:HlyD family efflux transporter periplasmic adaptor subunit [Vicinamibacterales bacterium]
MSPLLTDRRLLLSVVVIGTLTAIALWPSAVAVEVATVSRGPLVVTVDEEGRTRVRDRFVVAAPVTGRVLRIELEPGDRVARGDVVARLQPESPPLLDARMRAEALAAVDSTQASLGHARAEEQRARAALAQTQRDLARTRRLTTAGVTTAQDLEAREADALVAEEAVNAAAFAVRAASAEVERAQARVGTSVEARGGGAVVVTSPADGVVLQRLRESESVVPAGEPLIEIGDPAQIEIVTDLLSTDAVRVRPGARAMIEQWGGETALAATVRRIEPAGFTKVSALGVEEQRVNVVLDFADGDEDSPVLGDAYRVETRIVLWEAPSVLKVPTNALFRDNTQWAVYVVSGGRARRTIVEIGHQTAQEAEVLDGLSEGTDVIVHPGDLVRDGARIANQ